MATTASTTSSRTPTSLIWVGGGNNLATNPTHWSPALTPIPGDTLTISSGTIDVVSNALAGDTLHTSGLGAIVDINTGLGATLNLSTGFSVTTNVTVDSQLDMHLNTGYGTLNVSGAPIAFIGSNTLGGTQTFANKLEGTATFTLVGAQGEGDLTKINGAVGRGLTFTIGGVAALEINDPSHFQGSIHYTAGLPVGEIGFKGIHATRAELFDGVLQMFDGNKLVDATRLTYSGAYTLQLRQTSTGVYLSEGYDAYSHGGTVVPLHVG